MKPPIGGRNRTRHLHFRPYYSSAPKSHPEKKVLALTSFGKRKVVGRKPIAVADQREIETRQFCRRRRFIAEKRDRPTQEERSLPSICRVQQPPPLFLPKKIGEKKRRMEEWESSSQYVQDFFRTIFQPLPSFLFSSSITTEEKCFAMSMWNTGAKKKEKKNRGASIVSSLLRHMLQEVSWAQGCNLL